jgi:predicted O-methyltransferase YrrM
VKDPRRYDGLPSVEDALEAMRHVEGWLTEEQAVVLFETARALVQGARIVEIGSHYGRSTIPLALGAADGVEIVAIDPFVRLRPPHEDPRTDEQIRDDDLANFEASLEAAGVRDRVRHVGLSSEDAAAIEMGPVDLLFVDGDHAFSAARFDIGTWGGRIRPGGMLLVHDAYSSVGVTLTQVLELFGGRRFRYLHREGSLAVYRREELAAQARVANGVRQLAPLPWFVRNVAVKIALRTGAAPVARLLGHGDAYDPI